MQAWQGALPTLYAATMDVPGNTYVGPHSFHEMRGWLTGVGRSQRALDPDLAKALWTESERLSGVTFRSGHPGVTGYPVKLTLPSRNLMGEGPDSPGTR